MKNYLYLHSSALAVGIAALFIANPSYANENTTASIHSDDSSSASQQVSKLPEGVNLIGVNEVKPGQLGISYEKYKLDNGLTILLHKDSSDPAVHVQVTYHVGSAREEVGRSGFAHFFEHMMFQGSENAPNGLHPKLISDAGGSRNGTTSADLTNYFQTVPSNYLEQILWLEADRMGFLLPAVTQEKFEIQRDTVKNERGQRVDNRPYGRLGEQIGEALYPSGHPYSWSTIGYLEDLDRASLDDLKRFFERWYGPNNALITISGDIDTHQTLEWMSKYFGAIPKGPEVRSARPAPAKLDSDRFVTMEDNVPVPLLSRSYPTVYGGHADEAPLDVLRLIIGEGNRSLLHKNLQETGLTSQVSASHACLELACTFGVLALQIPKEGSGLATINSIIDKTFEDFEKRGVKQKDIDLFVSSRITAYSRALDGIRVKARVLSGNEITSGNPDQIQDKINHLKSVTTADVMRVYNKYIKNQPSLTVSVVPEGKTELAAAANNWTMTPRAIPNLEDDSNIITAQAFDRSVIPPVSDRDITIKSPEVWRDSLANGIKLIGNSQSEVPLTTIVMRIAAGQQNQSIDQLGVSAFATEMLGDHSLYRTIDELEERMSELGTTISIDAKPNDTTLRLSSRSENLTESLEILEERLLSPKFDPESFERMKRVRLQNIKARKNVTRNQSNRVFQQKLYGTENPIGYNSLGTVETVSNITLKDVKKFYKKHFVPQVTSVTVVSNLSQDAIKNAFKGFNSWKGTGFAQSGLKNLPELDAGTLYLIDIPGAAQSSIRIGRRTLPENVTGDYYKLAFINSPLGGTFNSRINLNLREEKGYTYGANTGLRGTRISGYFQASSEVRSDATGPAITEFLAELKKFHEEGPTEEELAETANALRKREALAYEVSFGKLSYLSKIDEFGVSSDYVAERFKMMDKFTKAEADQLAQKYFNPDDMIIVVAGDKKEIIDDLQLLGKKIVEVEAK